jgi:hypothetical protein
MLRISQLLFPLATVGLAIAPIALPAIASLQPVQSARTDAPIQDLVTSLKRDEPPLGSRGVICPISPGLLGDTDVVWSDRPIFLWQGHATQIALRTLTGQETLWQQALTETNQSATYSGAPLQPGQLYEWELVDGTDSRDYVFQVMEPSDRDRISGELQTLETRLKDSGASEEAIAIEQARYFAQQGLWSDAMQTLQSVDAPSAELTQTVAEMTRYLCGTTSNP